MRSRVLAPIEPVAPNIVTLRRPTAGCGSVRVRLDRKLMGAVIGLPHQQAGAGIDKAATQQPDHTRNKRGGPTTIETVHHAAVAGDELAGILGAEPALDPRFEQIAE